MGDSCDRVNSMKSLAPIVFFAFNRPQHARASLEALARSPIAADTELIVYLDQPRNDHDVAPCREVALLVKGIEGFRSVAIRPRPSHWGLAKSIIQGVTEVMDEFGRAIVIEDDVVVSPAFLQFMNDALEHYEADERVWHIAGYTEDVDANGLNDFFFWRAMYCWGWASWQSRWRHFRRDPVELIAQFDRQMIHRFNVDGAINFWSQVEWNAAGGGSSWAIFWYATIFRQNGLCLNPATSFVCNIGFDGTGTNAPDSSTFYSVRRLNINGVFKPPAIVAEDLEAVQRIKSFYSHKDQPD